MSMRLRPILLAVRKAHRRNNLDREIADLRTNTGARLEMLCEDIGGVFGVDDGDTAVWPIRTESGVYLTAVCMTEDAARTLLELAVLGLHANSEMSQLAG